MQLLTRVQVKDFLSFTAQVVNLGTLTVLVGPNGSGKSNLLDAVRFMSQAVTSGLDAAITARGGITAVRRRTATGRPPDVEVRLDAELDAFNATYTVVIEAQSGGDWHLKSEECSMWPTEVAGQASHFAIGTGMATFGLVDDSLSDTLSELSRDRARDSNALMLPLLTGIEPFSALCSFLKEMSFYSIFPDILREPQKPLASYPLDEHGQNLNSVLRSLRDRKRPEAGLIRDALSALVPGARNFRVQQAGGYLTVALALQRDDQEIWFDAAQCSDGTLRILGILAALHQAPPRSLIAIEEPELTIHPGALGLLCDEIVEASKRSQILITTHSPDLISRVPIESLRVVEMTAQGTLIGPVAPDQVAAVTSQLFSPGDLVRIEGLRRASA
jgi:predicted ATPase